MTPSRRTATGRNGVGRPGQPTRSTRWRPTTGPVRWRPERRPSYAEVRARPWAPVRWSRSADGAGLSFAVVRVSSAHTPFLPFLEAWALWGLFGDLSAVRRDARAAAGLLFLLVTRAAAAMAQGQLLPELAGQL